MLAAGAGRVGCIFIDETGQALTILFLYYKFEEKCSKMNAMREKKECAIVLSVEVE